jgi:hypothetical protein
MVLSRMNHRNRGPLAQPYEAPLPHERVMHAYKECVWDVRVLVTVRKPSYFLILQEKCAIFSSFLPRYIHLAGALPDLQKKSLIQFHCFALYHHVPVCLA